MPEATLTGENPSSCLRAMAIVAFVDRRERTPGTRPRSDHMKADTTQAKTRSMFKRDNVMEERKTCQTMPHLGS